MSKKQREEYESSSSSSSISWGNDEEKKKLEGWKTKEIEGSPNDPLYVSKQTYNILISLLQVDMVYNMLTDLLSPNIYFIYYCF